jgi:hypothetical protein
MSYSYIYQSAQKITLGWGDEAKETPFGGLTWSGHFSGVATYEGALDRVAVLENELAGARVERDVKLVELGDLNRRRSDRSSGLTRSSNAQSKFVVSGEGI